VNVDNVTFSYGEGLPNVLENISLQFLPGEFVAIVGASGCGKSTLVRILLGFETPQIGTVFFDNQDIRTLNKRELRSKLGVVLQNGSIFTGTIYQNIVCGGLYSKEDVERAVKLANLEEDLKKMGMGLHTFLQSDALTLSSGEAQRILIARALIGKPRVLILDEASNCLDANSQEILSKNVAELNITRIVIAHRLSTVVDADRIYVMDQGKVVDSGTYTDLMSKEGLFKDLVSQSKKQNTF
jgi:ATP-binding cassette subfamily C protein